MGLKTDTDMQWLNMFVAYLAAEKTSEELSEKILSSYHESILRMDVNAYRREWETVKSKWFIPRYFAKK